MTLLEELKLCAAHWPAHLPAVAELINKAAMEIEAFENQVSVLRKEQQTLYDDPAELRRQNSALASALRKVVAWYDSKDSIDVLIDIEKEVKEALAAQPEGGAK